MLVGGSARAGGDEPQRHGTVRRATLVYLEYKVISLLWLHDKEEQEGASVVRISGHESALNELGRLGWELVGIDPHPGWSASGDRTEPGYVQASSS